MGQEPGWSDAHPALRGNPEEKSPCSALAILASPAEGLGMAVADVPCSPQKQSESGREAKHLIKRV